MKTLLGLSAILAALLLAGCGNGNNANRNNHNNANPRANTNANGAATTPQPQTFGNTQGNPHAIRVPPSKEMATPPGASTTNQVMPVVPRNKSLKQARPSEPSSIGNPPQ